MKKQNAIAVTRRVLVLCIAAMISVPAARAQESETRRPLTLMKAVELAQSTHPSVGIARASESAALAGLGQAKSRWWPQLGTQASVVGYNEPMLVAPIHGFTEEQFQRIEFERMLVQGNVSLAWTLFDGGARVNRIRGAQAEAAGAAAGVTATEQVLTIAVTVAYLQVLSARGVLDAREQQMESLNGERRRVEQFLAEGQAAEVELLRVDAALAEAEAELVATVTRLDLAERNLARLIDVAVSEARFDNLGSVTLPGDAPLEERAELVRRSASNNPELERARQEVASTEATHRVAKASWIPRFDVQGGYQAFTSNAGNVSDLWSVGVALNWPIFSGGYRSNTIGRASAVAEAARANLQLLDLQVEENVDLALNTALETSALVEALTRAVQHSSEVVRIEQLSLEVGAGTQTDYLRAEANLSRARAFLVEAQHAEIAARVELARVVGELTLEWLAGNLEIGR